MRRVLHSPSVTRLIPHHEFQCSTFIEFIPIHPTLFQRFTVQRSRLYIIGIRCITSRFNHKRFSRRIHRTKFDFNLIKQWTANLESRPFTRTTLYEPTNHLDMKTKDILKQALLDFDGTLIVVSHDRDFLDGLVSKVYEFGNQKVTEHLCGIYEFLEKKKMDSLQELEKK